ncbi:MAG: DUF6687 family protein [Candidatus Obscuribacterales bacterium]
MTFVYVPYHELAEQPNVIVDGRGNKNTILTLSHWPANETPEKYKDDLSAQIVFRYLESGDAPLEGAPVAVSNNHFDEDGLVSVFSMVNPDYALANKEFLIDVARAGDFSRFEDREAARVSWIISAWTDPERTPLSREVFGGTYEELNQVLYEETIKRLPNFVEKGQNLYHLWQDDDRFLTATEDAIASGLITIEEDPDLDLAIVHIADQGVIDPELVPGHGKSLVSRLCQPMAIHNACERYRVLVMHKRSYELYYRYETWIDFVSSALMPRVNLSNLAAGLNERESRLRWRFNGVSEIIGRLSFECATGDDAGSDLSPAEFAETVRESLMESAVTP